MAYTPSLLSLVTHSFSRSGLRTGLVALLLSANACDEGVECIIPPCLQPLAVEVTVTVEPTGAPATGAFIALTGAGSGGGPCLDAKCVVLGVAGTYELDIGAPGYQTVHRRVVVPGSQPECGCPSVETQRLTVALPSAG
jgi:hypothetical protein